MRVLIINTSERIGGAAIAANRKEVSLQPKKQRNKDKNACTRQADRPDKCR